MPATPATTALRCHGLSGEHDARRQQGRPVRERPDMTHLTYLEAAVVGLIQAPTCRCAT